MAVVGVAAAVVVVVADPLAEAAATVAEVAVADPSAAAVVVAVRRVPLAVEAVEEAQLRRLAAAVVDNPPDHLAVAAEAEMPAHSAEGSRVR